MIKQPTKEELLALREQFTNVQIAAKFNISTSTLKRWIKGYDIPHRIKKKPVVTPNTNTKPKLSLQSGIGLMDRARLILGKRLTEDKIGYKLDGRYARTDTILNAAKLRLNS